LFGGTWIFAGEELTALVSRQKVIGDNFLHFDELHRDAAKVAYFVCVASFAIAWVLIVDIRLVSRLSSCSTGSTTTLVRDRAGTVT
jgi:hypothetical protein